MIEKAKALLKKEDLSFDKINSEIQELNKSLSNIKDFSSKEYISLSKQFSDKNSLKNSITELQKQIKTYEDAVSIDSSDIELYQLAKNEITESKARIKYLINKIKDLTIKPLPNDENKAIIEIRPGVGGVEASIFAENLYRMYSRYLNSAGMKINQYSIDYDSEAGIKEAIFLVEDPGSFDKLRFESGVHRVQRVPTTESAGRIHTSTASVVILPEIDTKDIKISQEDLKIDFYRSSGPGGQSVNTTDSAVRITHIPTKIVVTCQNGKSQHKNKEMAMSVLVSKLKKIEEEKKLSQEKNIRDASILGGDRSAKIRTYNFPQGRITDHRIQKSWFNIDSAMNGEINEIVLTVRKELRAQLGD